MKKKYVKQNNMDCVRYGKILKANSFNTDRGFYTIRLIDYKGSIWFYKMKNGNVVEVKKFKIESGEK